MDKINQSSVGKRFKLFAATTKSASQSIYHLASFDQPLINQADFPKTIKVDQQSVQVQGQQYQDAY